MYSDPDYEEYMNDWRHRVASGLVSEDTCTNPSVVLSDEYAVPSDDAWELSQ